MKYVLILALASITPLVFFAGKTQGYESGLTDGKTIGWFKGNAEAQEDATTTVARLRSMGLCNYAQHICKVRK